MGSFQEHISQSNNNLDFLSKVNNTINERWDWQVTVCFYSALHLVNAHIVDKINKNYLSHNQVSDVLNPYNQMSVARLDEETYTSYIKLMQLSRRSRYLLNENFQKNDAVDIQPTALTYDKHFKKAVFHLDKIMQYLAKNYPVTFKIHELKCVVLNANNLSYFKVI